MARPLKMAARILRNKEVNERLFAEKKISRKPYFCVTVKINPLLCRGRADL